MIKDTRKLRHFLGKVAARNGKSCDLTRESCGKKFDINSHALRSFFLTFSTLIYKKQKFQCWNTVNVHHNLSFRYSGITFNVFGRWCSGCSWCCCIVVQLYHHLGAGVAQIVPFVADYIVVGTETPFSINTIHWRWQVARGNIGQMWNPCLHSLPERQDVVTAIFLEIYKYTAHIHSLKHAHLLTRCY